MAPGAGKGHRVSHLAVVARVMDRKDRNPVPAPRKNSGGSRPVMSSLKLNHG